MPESLLQKVDRLNQEIKHLTQAKFDILSCRDTNHQILDAIEHEITERIEWIDQNSIKAIHAMIYHLLHSFDGRPVISTDWYEKIILKHLISKNYIDVLKVKDGDGKFQNGYVLTKKFEELPSVEELYQDYVNLLLPKSKRAYENVN